MSDEADPYVKFDLMQDNSIFKGDVDYGNQVSTKRKDDPNPVYNELFKFQIPTLKNMQLDVSVLDDDMYCDDKLGHLTISLDTLGLDAEPLLVRKKIADRMFDSDANDSWITLWLSFGESSDDDDAASLSHVGQAAYECLRNKHFQYHHQLWNVTNGRVVGNLHQTPIEAFPGHPTGGEDGHDDWFPEKMAEIVGRTQKWCDVLSLGPPDGLFMERFKVALGQIVETAAEECDEDSPVIIRMCFGNIPGMPVNCDKIVKELTEDLPEDANIRLWVGAWRRMATWNHAKIIAVDGRCLHTGGHNLWDPHYLKYDPIHDLSLELEGKVTVDGHLFANEQWEYIHHKQEKFWGKISDKLPDGLPQTTPCRVTISEWPVGAATEYPPHFRSNLVKERFLYLPEDETVPIITMGRYGVLLEDNRPSDDAFIAMFGAAETSIRMALQDLGPVCIPGTKRPLPGTKWPTEYLSVLGRVMWTKGVDVEIVLSNPSSIPGGLSPLEACYGNGWTCDDVASEIIKTIQTQFPDAEDGDLRSKVSDNLRICFLRNENGNQWEDEMTIGLHSKHFIIDDTATYIGSQNLYVCDLAEWGVVIDNQDQTQKFMEDYWNPMWECSYTGEDVDVDAVMDGLDIDRCGDDPEEADEETLQQMEEAQMANFGCCAKGDVYDSEDSESSSSSSEDDDDDGSENSEKRRRRRRKERRASKRAAKRERRKRRRRRRRGKDCDSD